jgi:hypothetical protein
MVKAKRLNKQLKLLPIEQIALGLTHVSTRALLHTKKKFDVCSASCLLGWLIILGDSKGR